MSTLTVAACQITASGEPRENLETIREAATRAAHGGARLVVLPEAAMACFGTDLSAVAQPLDGEFATGVRKIAEKLDVTLVVGMFEPAGDGRVHNTLLVTGRGVEAAYRKHHLYDAFGSRESEHVAPGTELVTVEVPLEGGGSATVGFATCYDVRFADQFTALGRAGAQVVALPASWGEGPGKAEQWDLLVRARAMDAQAWLVACDQAWQPPRGAQALGIGRSAVVGPLGEVRARLDHRADVLVTTVDLGIVDDVRSRVPILEV
nr:carbon-nitrogen hydrolase family protein [Mobilicoccus pelagius]